MKLSVIVPVYNVEKFLEPCVASILEPDADGISLEVILVDDCSPDGSGALCDRIAAADGRVKVVHRLVNGGLSEARNSGLDCMTGDWVTFFDSDDFLAPGTLSSVLRAGLACGADVVEYPVTVGYGSAVSYVYSPLADNGGRKSSTFDDWVRRRGYIHSYAWNKIYDVRLWDGVRFPAGKYFEDLATVPYVLGKARCLALTGEGMYFYCVHEGSISRTPGRRKSADLLEAGMHLYDYLLGKGYGRDSLADLYMELSDRQVDLVRAGGDVCLPLVTDGLWRVALSPHADAKRRLKVLLILATGSLYYRLMTLTGRTNGERRKR